MDIWKKFVHAMTYIDLAAKIAAKVAAKFLPGWMVDIVYYLILAIDWLFTKLDEKYRKKNGLPPAEKEKITLEEFKDKVDPFGVKRYYRRERSLKNIVQRTYIDWLKKNGNMEKVQAQIDAIAKKRNGNASSD